MILIILVSIGCDRGPKIIAEPTADTEEQASSGIFSDSPSDNSQAESRSAGNLHVVTALETMETDRYTYIRVRENEREYWVATSTREISIGETYYYSGALRKTNFESKEYGRVFDEIYLIGNIVPANHAETARASGQTNPKKVDVESHSTSTPVQSKVSSSGTIQELTILELIDNPQNFKNQQVQLQGTVQKVNSNIMGRNWIHLKDGTKDDFDLVVTSSSNVREGDIIKIQGVVSLDVDFGAGYKYDIIIENARIF